MTRAGLIARKELVQAEIARTRRELARLQQLQPRSTGSAAARLARQIEALEARLADLMAEEHTLRLEIDRSPR